MVKTNLNQKMQNKLEALRHDSKTPVYRGGKFGIKAKETLLPWFWQYYNAHLKALPPGLQQVEAKYAERIENPRSIFIAEAFKKECESLGQTRTPAQAMRLEEAIQLREDLFKDEFRSGVKTFELPASVATKSSGPPDFIAKRQWFNDTKNKRFMHNVLSTIFRGLIPVALGMVFGSFAGLRTQQAKKYKPGKEIVPKLRVINMVPAIIFWLSYQVIRTLIDKAKELFNIGKKFPIYVYYRNRSETAAAMHDEMKKAKSVVVLDMTAFDHFVRDYENEADYRWFLRDILKDPKWRYVVEFLIRYSNTAELIHPWGILSRKEGRLSGMEETNIFNSTDNVCDVYQALQKVGLAEFVTAFFVNGDDITIMFSSVVTEKDVAKFSPYMARICEPSKCWYGTVDAFYCKTVWWDGLYASPISKAINSIIYTERDSTILKASKEYIYIAMANIIDDVGQHPWREDFIKIVRSFNKYKFADLDAVNFDKAMDVYYADKKTTGTEDVPSFEEKKLRTAKMVEILG